MAHQPNDWVMQVHERLSHVQRNRQKRQQTRPPQAPRVQQPALQRLPQGACLPPVGGIRMQGCRRLQAGPLVQHVHACKSSGIYEPSACLMTTTGKGAPAS